MRFTLRIVKISCLWKRKIGSLELPAEFWNFEGNDIINEIIDSQLLLVIVGDLKVGNNNSRYYNAIMMPVGWN